LSNDDYTLTIAGLIGPVICQQAEYKCLLIQALLASYCAQWNLSNKYVLEWIGPSSSVILDMYFTMNDRQAQIAVNSLSFVNENIKVIHVYLNDGPAYANASAEAKRTTSCFSLTANSFGSRLTFP
jgi:hypothetical protein